MHKSDSASILTLLWGPAGPKLNLAGFCLSWAKAGLRRLGAAPRGRPGTLDFACPGGRGRGRAQTRLRLGPDWSRVEFRSPRPPKTPPVEIAGGLWRGCGAGLWLAVALRCTRAQTQVRWVSRARHCQSPVGFVGPWFVVGLSLVCRGQKPSFSAFCSVLTDPRWGA